MAMGEKVDFSVIQRQIVTGLDILIHLGRMRDRTRKVLQISELCGIKNGEIYLNTLYRFQETGVKGEKVHGIWKKRKFFAKSPEAGRKRTGIFRIRHLTF